MLLNDDNKKKWCLHRLRKSVYLVCIMIHFPMIDSRKTYDEWMKKEMVIDIIINSKWISEGSIFKIKVIGIICVDGEQKIGIQNVIFLNS